MKIFSPEEIKTSAEKDVQSLEVKRRFLTEKVTTLSAKVADLQKEYQALKIEVGQDFSGKLMAQKSKLLKEYQQLEKKVEEKKEILYGLIEKQDQLDERERAIDVKEQNLNHRETFIKALEEKMRNV